MWQAAKRILEEHKAKPVAVLGRYAGAYTHIRKRDWWDYDLSGGPIVEQAGHPRPNSSPSLSTLTGRSAALKNSIPSGILGFHSFHGQHDRPFVQLSRTSQKNESCTFTFIQATHFVDLMRYLVGEIDKDTIQAIAVRPDQMILEDMAPPPEAEHPVSSQTYS